MIHSPTLDFPLSAWPPQAYPLEPAHGFFRRLAQVNSQDSCRVLADLVGIKSRHIDTDEMLEFCREFPVQNLEHLAAANPRFRDATVVLNGQIFHANVDYSVRRPRYCCSCLREGNYYRNWFDLRVVRACPLHNETLVDDGYEGVLEWWHPFIGRTDLVVARVDPNQLDWERYLFARMGLMRADPNPMLDDQPLRDIIRISALIGRAVDRSFPLSAPKPRVGRSELAARGYDILKGGRESLRRFFAKAAEARIAELPEGDRFGFEKSFGWMAKALGYQPKYPMVDRVLEVLAEAAHDQRMFSRKDLNAIAQVPTGILTLRQCSDAVGLPVRRVRDLAVRLGMIAGSQPRSHCHGFSAEQVDELVTTLSRKIGRREAAELLGLGQSGFDEFVQDHDIRPLVRVGGGEKNSDVFDARSFQEVLASVKAMATAADGSKNGVSFDHYARAQGLSPASLAKQIVAAEVHCVGWNDEQIGFRGAVLPVPICLAAVSNRTDRRAPRKQAAHPGMSFADASAFLGAHPTSIRCLVDQTVLHLEPNDSGRDRVTFESVERFGERYAPARLYAEAMGLAPQKVLADFAATKVECLPPEKFARTMWVERASVIDKFGPDWDLRSSCASSQALWNGLKNHWDETRSPNKLVGACGRNATIKSGRGDVLARLKTLSDRGAVALIVRADGTTPKRLRRLRDNIEAVRACWPGMSILVDEPSQMELGERFVIGHDGERLQVAVQAISHIATTLRQTVSAAA